MILLRIWKIWEGQNDSDYLKYLKALFFLLFNFSKNGFHALDFYRAFYISFTPREQINCLATFQ